MNTYIFEKKNFGKTEIRSVKAIDAWIALNKKLDKNVSGWKLTTIVKDKKS